MTSLPLCVSLPHAGLEQPIELAGLPILGIDDVVRDGDEGAATIYGPLGAAATVLVSTPIARAFLDMNRDESDLRKDGIVKTHTCLDVPIYRQPLPPDVVEVLLARYHRPYHAALSAASSRVRFGIDCHTMMAVGPPVGPDPGAPRPALCLANAHGTFPEAWMDALARCLEYAFERVVAINEPFRGGHIIRSHGGEMPWVMLELSRAPYLTPEDKSQRVVAALDAFCRWLSVHERTA
jgi:N-formylglutamate amidohydrolase